MPCPAVAEGDADVAGDVAVAVAAQPESPITALSAMAAIQTLLLFDSNRRALGRRGFVGLLFMMRLLLFGNLFRECQPLP
jgi:hypothetical protein